MGINLSSGKVKNLLLSLIDGEMTKKFRTSYDSVPKRGKNISREDLAYFLSEAIGKEEYINNPKDYLFGIFAL